MPRRREPEQRPGAALTLDLTLDPQVPGSGSDGESKAEPIPPLPPDLPAPLLPPLPVVPDATPPARRSIIADLEIAKAKFVPVPNQDPKRRK